MVVEIPDDLKPYVAYLPPIVIAEVFADALRQKIFGHPESKAVTLEDIKQLLEAKSLPMKEVPVYKPPVIAPMHEPQLPVQESSEDDSMDFLADIMR